MLSVFPAECQYNILGHVVKCWQYSYPTGSTLESAIYEGLRPFFPTARLLGSPSTITDVCKDKDALDVKGKKVLSHIKRPNRNSNQNNNLFAKQNVPGHGTIYVRIPRSTITQVRRPKVDLKSYRGDPKKIIESQIQDYKQFAVSTSTKDGCNEIYSLVLLYGIDEKKGFKSVFLSITKFGTPQPTRYDIGYKKNGKACSYNAYDDANNLIFSLSSFNKGSSNFYKMFETQNGILMTWPLETKDQTIHTKEFLESFSAIQVL